MFFRKRENDNRFLIAGLGNPGKEYSHTRHNVGFLALDDLADRNRIRVTRARFSALTGEGMIGGVPVTLIKPTTYMNLSGQSVAAAAGYYKLPAGRIIVLCDDIALPPGTVRIRERGSSGGQKGLRSIEQALQTDAYIRIRIGVGDRKSGELADHVLAAPSAADKTAITGRFSDINDAVGLILSGDLSAAQSLYNSSL